MLCTVFFFGKLAGWQVDVFSLPAGSTSPFLVYLKDKLSSLWFLVDSRASLSVSGVKLLTADGSSVSCSGSRIITLPFGSNNVDCMFQLAPDLFQSLGQIFSAITIF